MPTTTTLEYGPAREALHEAYAAAEGVQFALRREANGTNPTFADIGELWTFVDLVEMTASDLNRLGRELRGELVTLDTRRLGD
jgi:hypothetical protein